MKNKQTETKLRSDIGLARHLISGVLCLAVISLICSSASGQLQRAIVTDFNGDGKPDYLLYNVSTRQTAIWYLNNNVHIGGALGPTLPVGWELAGVADFNRDGHPDYLLFNTATRQTALWYINKHVHIGATLGPILPTGYRIEGVADFNRDGHPDYLLFNASTGRTAIWYLAGVTRIAAAYGPTIPGVWVWELVATADFNGDGKPDYLLYKGTTGQTAIWYLSNNVHIASAAVPTVPAGR